ncbi:tyrosine-type recombinase/integrase [Neorhodopirellula pilleata]|uniref:Phage integrase family protein n=1 Tax=Neorhodopirellula pilleata TaxID=2714738 RepID=A0A5C5ZWL4_9BACT|nr:tyrosine-type recombinase/integrase [Neorhodopirellula pilleata]TWT91659.1 Phage integrase family protein [Neorhodopirellula pilleata]
MSGGILRNQGRKTKPAKPDKPYPEYPLTPHASGKWCKKVRGKLHYFGSWDDPDGALNEWLAKQDTIRAGGDPNFGQGDHDIDWLVNEFLESKNQQKEQGDLSQRAFNDYFAACQRITEFFGKQRLLATIDAPDFGRFRASFPSTWGPSSINNAIARSSAVFNFAYNVGGVDRPIRFGPNFKRVSKKRQRLHRATKPQKLFTAAEVHKLVDEAPFQVRAMILLGLNAGYGNADCGRLLIPMIDFKRNWLEDLRTKTGIERAAWLWPETVDAIQYAIANRYPTAPSSLEDHVFITKRRQAWFHDDGSADPLSQAFARLRDKVLVEPVVKKLVESGADAKKARKEQLARYNGVGFYALRHTFETIAGNSKDQVAVNHVMGHCDDSMAAVYREGIDQKRIKEVCQFVRKWWLAGKPKATKRKTEK